MIDLNDKRWKNFMLADIFKVDLSKGDNQPSLLEKGKYPLISAGTKNNGVCYFINKGDGKSQLFEKNTITVDMFGTPFYHAYDFYSVSHGRVNILSAISDEFNKYIGLFIITCITEGTKSKYSYNQMCSQKRILRQPIMLPVDENDNPDYLFMEEFIKEREAVKRKQYLDYCNEQLKIFGGGIQPNTPC